MNAVNSLQTQPQGSEARPYEPSMEEILASIRRIIADDQSLAVGQLPRGAPAPRHEPPVEPQRPPTAYVFDASAPTAMGQLRADSSRLEARAPGLAANIGLPDDRARTPDEFVAPPHAHRPDDAAAGPSPSFAHPSHESVGAAGATAAPPDPGAPSPDDQFDGSAAYFEAPIELDEQLAAAASPLDLFSASTHHSVASSFSLLAATRLADNSEELLGLAREMIRPMLKTWLDDNLPSMVERMVRAEIERVARGGR